MSQDYEIPAHTAITLLMQQAQQFREDFQRHVEQDAKGFEDQRGRTELLALAVAQLKTKMAVIGVAVIVLTPALTAIVVALIGSHGGGSTVK